MKLLRTWTFTWWEIGLLKVCLISLGLLVGLYFGSYLTSLLALWWALFVGTSLYFILKFARDMRESNESEHEGQN